MKLALQAAWELPSFCLAAGSEYYRTGLVCLPPSWVSSRRRDPYAFYAKLRDRSPVHRSALADGVVLSRMADVAWALADERVTSDVSCSNQWRRAKGAAAEAAAARPLVQMDGVDHARCRGEVSAALNETSRAQFLGLARQVVQGHVEQLPQAGPIELMEQFVFPVTRQLILGLLGIPGEYQAAIGQFMRQGLTFAFHHGENLLRYPLVMSPEAKGARQFRGDVRRVFRQVSEHPFERSAGGVLPALLRAVQEQAVSLDEALVLCEEIAIASFERSAYQLGNSLLAVIERPALWRRLSAEPERLPAAVRELHRFDPAVQAIFRFAREGLELHGEVIQAGEPLVLLLASANRDERYYQRPDEIDIERTEPQQLTFGKGAHACIGAWISRAIHELALATIMERYQALRLVAPPAWSGRIPLRGLQSLRVTAAR